MKPVRIVIFAKAPLPGMAKTRLIPALGEKGAAGLAQRMLQDTVEQALAADMADVELCVAPGPDAPQWQCFRDHAWPLNWQSQGDGDLGDRLAHASKRGDADGCAVLLIGTDCPGLTATRLQQAMTQLQTNDAVINPSTDGGYVLLGLQHFHASLFQGVSWSTDRVAFETLSRIHTLGWSVDQLPPLTDIDEPEDLAMLPSDWLSD